jgi:hypothetical protein
MVLGQNHKQGWLPCRGFGLAHCSSLRLFSDREFFFQVDLELTGTFFLVNRSNTIYHNIFYSASNRETAIG